MARTKLDELLPSSPGPSRSELAQQLAQVSTGGSGDASLSGASSSSSVADVVNSLVQGPAKDLTDQISALNTQMTSLSSIQQTQFGATQDNTQALLQNTIAQSSSGTSVGSTVGSIASTVLGGGSILSPIVSGILSLFGGDSSQASTTTLPFLLPAPVQYQTSLGGGSGQASPVNQSAGGQSPAQTSTATPQVNIQVNAMDSQSFLDHRDEIAKAVREVLLTSNSLNDVISELS